MQTDLVGRPARSAIRRQIPIAEDTYNAPIHMETLDPLTSSEPEHPSEPVRKRPRLQQNDAELDDLSAPAPMELANGNGLVDQDDRVGPRKLIKRYPTCVA